MNTRKYPRTLQQAFGPYTSSHIEEHKQPMDWQDVVVTVACCVIGFIWLVVFITPFLGIL